MDRVRFGRALGRGARIAAQTAYEALDAATAPGPRPPGAAASPARPVSPKMASPNPVPDAVPVTRSSQGGRSAQVSQAVHTAGRVHGSVRQAKQGMFAPVKRASRALTLEMTGSFFALFALSFSIAAWRARAGLHDRAVAPHFWVHVVLAGLFGYFAVSSFVRARKL